MVLLTYRGRGRGVCHEEVDCMNCDQFTWFLNVLKRELFSVKGSDTDRVARMRKLFQ